ncbi:MAG: hypothetical protein ACMUIU_13505 [bacterium]
MTPLATGSRRLIPLGQRTTPTTSMIDFSVQAALHSAMTITVIL